MNRPPSRYVFQRKVTFVDAVIPEGTVVDGLDVSKLPHAIRNALHRRREQMAITRPEQKVVAVEFEGKPRWVLAPEDVRLHLTAKPGMLRRRRVSRD